VRRCASGRRSAIGDRREEILRIAAKHGASNVRVFGSFARGETRATSDLDVLVDMAPGRTLLDLIALSGELESVLGIRIDVVTESALSPYLKARILAEAVAL
jgi:predicted nucleotidyltransferase